MLTGDALVEAKEDLVECMEHLFQQQGGQKKVRPFSKKISIQIDMISSAPLHAWSLGVKTHHGEGKVPHANEG